MKKNIIFIVVVALILNFLILLSSFYILIHNDSFYQEQFTKNNVYTTFGNSSYVDAVNSNLINYLSNKEKLLDVYTQREVLHLQDVKNLFKSFTLIFYVLIILFLILFSLLLFYKYKFIHLILIFNFFFVIFILLLSLLFYFINFNWLFNHFHLLLFNNNYWILDNSDILIQLYPQSFFISAFLRIIFYYSIFGVISFVVGFALMKININKR